MPCYLYVLQNLKKDRRYIGITENVESRLSRHNAGFVKSTSAHGPWNLVYTEKYATKDLARYREHTLKGSAHKRRELFEKFLR